MEGNVTGDSVTAPAQGEVGEKITISYSLALAKINNRIVFYGTTPALAQINETVSAGGTTTKSGTIEYTVSLTDAADGTITIDAVFSHSDKELDYIKFENTQPVIKTYGDEPFTRVTDNGTGTGAITYKSSDMTVATVDANTGTVTILKAGDTTIIATKAEDNTHAGATAVYNLTVEKKPVTITGLSAVNKEYDGTTAATASGTAEVNDLVGSDAVTVIAGTAAFNNKNVGTGKTVTFSGYSLGGADADNYTLSGQPASATADITAKPVSITGLSASNKVYDGTPSATVGGTAVINGKIGSDTVTLTGGTAAFADKNVGTGKTVTFSNYSLGGTDAGNYTLSAQPANATADITAKSVTITGLTASNRVYDGTTTVTISGTAVVNGKIESDTVTVTAGTAAFATKTVGNNKTVTFSNYLLGGADAGNYTLSGQPSATANITALQLTILGTTVASKQYDTNTTATISAVGTLSDIIGGDTVNVTAAGTFASANVGTRDVTVVYSINGADAGNYIKPVDATISGTINKATGRTVSAPTMASRTTTSITINAVTVDTPNLGQTTVEYAIATTATEPSTDWTTGKLSFTGLTSGTVYYVFARTVGGGDFNWETGAAQSSEISTIDASRVTQVTFEDDALNKTYGSIGKVVADPAASTQKSLQISYTSYGQSVTVPIDLPFALSNYGTFTFRFRLANPSGSDLGSKSIGVFVSSSSSGTTTGNNSVGTAVSLNLNSTNTSTYQSSWTDFSIPIANPPNNAIKDLVGQIYITIFTNSNGLNYLVDDLTFVLRDSVVLPPSISPTTATFDKKTGETNNANITVNMSPQGKTLTSITNDENTLTQGTTTTGNYYITGNTVTLRKEYLTTLPIGKTTLTFNFSGDATSTIEITIKDSDIADPVISPTTATFDKKTGETTNADIPVTMTLDSSVNFTSITGGTPAITSANYTVSGNTVTLKKEYLATLANGTTTLTFNFSNSATQTIAITIKDSSVLLKYNFAGGDTIPAGYPKYSDVSTTSGQNFTATIADSSATGGNFQGKKILRVTKDYNNGSPKFILPFNVGTGAGQNLSNYPRIIIVARGVSGDVGSKVLNASIGSTQIGATANNGFSLTNNNGNDPSTIIITYRVNNADVDVSGHTGAIEIGFWINSPNAQTYEISSIELVKSPSSYNFGAGDTLIAGFPRYGLSNNSVTATGAGMSVGIATSNASSGDFAGKTVLRVEKTTGYSSPSVVLPFNAGAANTFNRVVITLRAVSGDLTGGKNWNLRSGTSNSAIAGQQSTSLGSPLTGATTTLTFTISNPGTFTGEQDLGLEVNNTQAFVYEILTIELTKVP